MEASSAVMVAEVNGNQLKKSIESYQHKRMAFLGGLVFRAQSRWRYYKK